MKGNIFIKRPVMAISISILILAIGLISLFTLPVEQYPDIAPPTVHVSATYTGADADAVMNSVIMPLEESINGVENMMYMTSTSTNAGSATIEVYFKQGTDPDMAAVNVQNRVTKAQGLLPAEVTRIGVSTQKRQTSFLQIDALVSSDGRYDKTFLGNYLDINVIPRIKRIEGVGDVMELGDTYSMRIWLNPERMAQYGLVPSDVTSVLGEQNIEAPTGSLGENSKNVFQYTMKYRGRSEKRRGIPEHCRPGSRRRFRLTPERCRQSRVGNIELRFRQPDGRQTGRDIHDLPGSRLQCNGSKRTYCRRIGKDERGIAYRNGIHHDDELQRLPLRLNI